ncbi:MAG: ImmA/IrrE family metallo-endopeptidase [Ahrensia sp.]|nr:ImmA/IrrE family metallo-endopeptidase [Ahrensia sp.]
MTAYSTFNEILANHQRQYPVQTVPIATALGIEVYKASGLPDTISGRIYRSFEDGGSSGYAIDVNADHHEVRRRFTIAHEIAHFVLHRDKIGDEMFDDYLYRSGLSNKQEWEANALAADILMPRHLIAVARSNGLNTVHELAMAFNVSETAMSIRLGRPA